MMPLAACMVVSTVGTLAMGPLAPQPVTDTYTRPGFLADISAQPMPMRSATPGR